MNSDTTEESISKIEHIIRATINDHEAYKRRIETYLSFLRDHKEKLEALDLEVDRYTYSSIDFNRLSHANVMKVILAFPGKWKKEAGVNASVDYILPEEYYGMPIRCWAGE